MGPRPWQLSLGRHVRKRLFLLETSHTSSRPAFRVCLPKDRPFVTEQAEPPVSTHTWSCSNAGSPLPWGHGGLRAEEWETRAWTWGWTPALDRVPARWRPSPECWEVQLRSLLPIPHPRRPPGENREAELRAAPLSCAVSVSSARGSGAQPPQSAHGHSGVTAEATWAELERKGHSVAHVQGQAPGRHPQRPAQAALLLLLSPRRTPCPFLGVRPPPRRGRKWEQRDRR